MGARSKARKRALDILFESELRGLAPGATLSDRQLTQDPPPNDYTVHLVEGVEGHLVDIDSVITEHAAGWTLERMPAVDRNILRIAVFELRYCDDVPSAVVLNEAVALAKDLSTDSSAGFVNGVLASVVNVSTSDHQTRDGR